nr:MAG TPA: hypothetical protein [Caudoviricetes sp.]
MITAPPDCYRCFLFLYCNIQSDIFCTILPSPLTTLNDLCNGLFKFDIAHNRTPFYRRSGRARLLIFFC